MLKTICRKSSEPASCFARDSARGDSDEREHSGVHGEHGGGEDLVSFSNPLAYQRQAGTLSRRIMSTVVYVVMIKRVRMRIDMLLIEGL